MYTKFNEWYELKYGETKTAYEYYMIYNEYRQKPAGYDDWNWLTNLIPLYDALAHDRFIGPEIPNVTQPSAYPGP